MCGTRTEGVREIRQWNEGGREREGSRERGIGGDLAIEVKGGARGFVR